MEKEIKILNEWFDRMLENSLDNHDQLNEMKIIFNELIKMVDYKN